MKVLTNKKAIWAVDCETDPFDYGRIPRPFLWGIYEGYTGDYLEFTDTDKLVDFLASNNVIAYAHNGGKFDWHFITHRMDPTKSLLIISGRLAKFQIGKCEFRDSFSLMPVALEQYQKSEFEYWKMESVVRHKYMDEIKTYLRSDCVNLWNMVMGFEEQYGRHLTLAGASMKTWQRMSGRKAPNSSQLHYDSFKPYYYGGRVQCFESGDYKMRSRSIDINSAYPTAMLEKHPIGLDFVTHDGKPKKAMKNWGPLFFKIRCVPRGAFPYRALNKMLYYPDEDVSRVYHVTGWELIAAIETGTVDELEFISWLEIEETVSFAGYINHFYDQRKQAKADGDEGKSLYTKLLMNSLYGKFASDPRVYRNYQLMPIDSLAKVLDEGKDFDYFKEWLLVSELTKKEKYRFYNLATAASITGNVRAALWRAICATPRPLYCDTDSILAAKFPTDSPAIIFGPELGQWEVEGYYDRAAVAGKKMYALHFSDDKRNGERADSWKVRSKGARLTHEELIKVANGEAVKFLPQAPTFSVHKVTPRFIPRVIRPTAADVRVVPLEFDPQNVTPVTGDEAAP